MLKRFWAWLTGSKADAKEIKQLPPAPKPAPVQVAVPVKVVPPPPVVETHTVDTPWYDEAKKHLGSKETDPKFQAFLVPFWKKLYGINYTSIVGSSRAWCGLFVGAMLYIGHAEYTKRGASAIAYDSFGQKIEWKTDGIPKGAIVRLNHHYDCKTSSDNHVTFADGDCAAADLLKAGATFNALGGNQSNQVKVSTYAVKEICEVRWPPNFPKPPKVTKSVNCSGKKTGTESTR